jgi:hypothetical protein
MKKLYTVREAVGYLGLDRQGLKQPLEALRWLRRTGRLRYAKVGRRILIEERWLDELIEQNAVTRGKPCSRLTGRPLTGTVVEPAREQPPPPSHRERPARHGEAGTEAVLNRRAGHALPGRPKAAEFDIGTPDPEHTP